MTHDPFETLVKMSKALSSGAEEAQADMDQVFAKLQKRKKNSPLDLSEMDRILSMPIHLGLSNAAKEEISRRLIDAKEFEAGFRFLDAQSEAIYAFDQAGGGFFTIGVGKGKAGISMMIADISYRHKGVDRSILFVPASVYSQTMLQVVPMWRKVANMAVPMIGLGGKPSATRLAIARSGQRGCYVMPYSLLSRSDAMEILGTIKPSLVISDEAHAFRNKKGSARTKKFLKYMSAMTEAGQRPTLVVMSGTMVSKGLKDYHHLLDMSLTEGSPLPRRGSLAYMWGQLIDTSASVDQQTKVGPLVPLVKWASGMFPDQPKFTLNKMSDLRRAYRLRLNSTMGVVSGGDQEIACSLLLKNVPVLDHKSADGWSELVDHTETLEELWRTPDGDELECAISLFKWKSELAAGFYNSLYWPSVEELAKQQAVSKRSAAGALAMGRTHLAIQQEYYKELRVFLEYSPSGMDTAMEVARQIHVDPSDIPVAVVDLYHQRKAVEESCVEEFGFFPSRWRAVIRVCDFKIAAAVKWARAHKSGILWVFNIGIGEWLFEALQKAGLDPVHAPAGANDVIESIGDPGRGGKGDRLVVASLTSHSVGKNLQAFSNQYCVQWPRFAFMAEQFIGRTHRHGQLADSLMIHTNLTLSFDFVNFAACLTDAVHAQQTLGGKQKIVTCDYDPLPKIFSPEFLREQGARPESLTREMKDLIELKFGADWKDQI